MRTFIIVLFILLVGSFFAYQLMPGSAEALTDVTSASSVHEWDIRSWAKAMLGITLAFAILAIVSVFGGRATRSSRHPDNYR